MTEYRLHKKADLGPCLDVRGYDGRIYAIQRDHGGRLAVLTAKLAPICTFDGIGNARQIEIKDGLAAISAREDGLWLFDVSEPTPRLLSHYRTVEFATGITLYKNLVLVSCRQYGVEIIDIADPCAPRYAGVIRMGEAQSACVYNDVLYGGVWGTMEVVAVDISNVTHPKTLGRIPLSGRGDGVVARDGILYAATGQHRRGIQNEEDPNDPMFGMGNGVELFDITDPAAPRPLGWHFFEKGHAISFDMWKPMLCGELLLCNDSVLGVYGYHAKTMEQLFHILPPPVNGEADPVTGTTVHGGKLYITTGKGGLYLFDDIPLSDTYRHDASGSVQTALPALHCEADGPLSVTQRYCGDFPVLAADTLQERALLALACGEAGVRLIDPVTYTGVAAKSDLGFCYDVKACGDLLCAALGELGIALLRFDGSTLTPLSELRFEASVQQVALSENGQFLALSCGGQNVKMLDIRDPLHPTVAFEHTSRLGLLYGENFLSNPVGGRGISLFWHREGLIFADPEGGDRQFHVRCWPLKTGILGFCPGNGCDVCDAGPIYGYRGGYVLLPEDESLFLDDLPCSRTENRFRGKFCVAEDRLTVTERADGRITLLDISDPSAPRAIGTLRTNATPSKAVSTPWGLLIPSRYGGLLTLEV